MASLADFATGKAAYTPPAAAPAPGQSGFDLAKFAKTKRPDTVSVSIDPTTRAIHIDAPDWYIKTQEFQTQVLPNFRALIGKNVDDNQFKAIMDSGMQSDMQKQLDELLPRQQAIDAYKAKYPKATDDNAMTYLRNVAAFQNSAKDGTTQVTAAVGKDGKPITVSVKDFTHNFTSKDDKMKANDLAVSLKRINDPKTDETTRAIQQSLVDGLQSVKAFDAGKLTKLNAGLNAFLANSDKGAVGWAVNKLFQPISALAGDGRDIAETARDQAKGDKNLELLGGVKPAVDIGGATGSLFTTAADIAATAPLGGEAAWAKAATILDKAPSIAAIAPKLATVAPDVADAIRAVPGAGDALRSASGISEAAKTAAPITKVVQGIVRQAPADIGFGAAESVNNGSYNSVHDFAVNTLTNAAALGGGKLVSRAIREIDTATNGSLNRASTEVGKTLLKGADKIESIPVVGNIIKKVGFNFVDQGSPIRRAARTAFANSKGAKETQDTKQYYMDVSNALHSAVTQGAPEAVYFRNNSPAWKAMVSKQVDLTSAGTDEAKIARYVNSRQVLERAERGQYTMKPAAIDALKQEVQDLHSPELDDYYKKVVDFNSEVTNFGVKNGITDQEILDRMAEDPRFGDDYIHLQADLSDRNKPVTYKTKSGKSLKSKTPNKKIRGRSDAEDLKDPFLVANDRLRAFTQLASENRVNTLLKQGIDQGWIAGEVLQDASLVRERVKIKLDIRNERVAVDKALKGEIDKLQTKIVNVLDDLEDFSGKGHAIVNTMVNRSVDNMLADMAEDPGIRRTINTFRSAQPELDSVTDEQIILEILDNSKKRITDGLTVGLRDSVIKEEREPVIQMFKDAINSRLTSKVDESGVTAGVNSKFDELRKLNAALSPGRELSDDNVISYFENGAKGHIKLADDDIMDYYNATKTRAEEGWFGRTLTQTSRVFRYLTTAVNPVFLLVNPIRDVPQAAVTAGVGLLGPIASHERMLEQAGLSADQVKAVSAQIEQEKSIAFSGNTEYTATRNNDIKNRKALINERKASGDLGKKAYVINAMNPKMALRNAEDVFSKTETFTRGRVYDARLQAAIKRGLPVDAAKSEALFYASQATTEFVNVGAKTRQFVRTVPYLQAAINGKASFARLFALDPIGVSARFAAGVVSPVMYLTIHNLATPDRKAAYEEIPEYEKRGNFIILLGDGSTHISIPMSYDLAQIVAPFRERLEAHANIDPNSFAETMIKTFLGNLPTDLSGLEVKDYQGHTDYANAISQATSSVIPQAVKPAYEAITGKSLYNNSDLGPSDEQLIQTGQVDPNADITNADRTYKTRNSAILGRISNMVGLPQSKVQAIFSDFTGPVGSFVLNGADKLIGAPSTAQGGKDFVTTLTNRFFGSNNNQVSTQAYYSGIDKLKAAKQQLQDKLTRLSKDNYISGESDTATNDKRQKLIDDYGQQVGDFAHHFGEFYSRAGGFKPYQADALVNLLNLGPDAGTFDEGTYQQGDESTVRTEAASQANRRAEELGLPSTAARDLYGQQKLLDDGSDTIDYYGTTRANGLIRERVYGAPKQIAFEYNQITKADKNKGIPSLYDAKAGYDSEIDKLYEAAKGLKGAAATAIYKKISDKQEEYMTKVFDPRIRELVQKYGPEALRNSTVAKEISSYVEVPGDYTPFASKKKQPYQTDDVFAYLKDRYGVGNLNDTSLKTDVQAEAYLKQINSNIASGHSARANYQLSDLQQQIDSGKVYVDHATMDRIAKMIKARNK